MSNRIVQAVYDLKDNITGKLQKISEALGINRTESTKTADTVERDNKRASESYKKTADSLGFLRENLGKIAAAAAAAMAALKAVDFGKHAFQGAADVEQSLARVKAIASSTAAEFEQLAQQVERSAAEVDFTTTASANAAAALAEQGQSAAEIFHTLTPTLLLAKTASLEVGEAAGIVDDALDLFGQSAENAGLMVDQLVAASKGSKEGIGGMATAIRALAPDARALGLDFQQLTGLLGMFGQNGIDAGKAAKGLRAIFQDLQDPTSKFSQSLGKLGDSSGNFTSAIETLRKSGKRGEEALLGLDGATRSLVLFLLQQAPGAVDEFTAKLAEAGGTAAKVAETLDDTFLGATDLFAHALERLGEGLLKSSLEPLRLELQKLAGQLNAFATSPDFDRLRETLAGIFKDGTAAFDEFIQSLDWQGMVDGAQNAFADIGTSLTALKDNLSATATALNTLGATIRVVYRAIAVVFNLAKVAISETVAQNFADLARLSASIDGITGTTSKLTIALESTRDAAAEASSKGMEALRANSEKVVENLSGLVGAADSTAPALEKISSGMQGVAAAANAMSAPVAKAAADFNATSGATENVAKSLGILPELFQADAAAATAAASAHQSHADEIRAARPAVDEARASMVALAKSGETNSEAFQQAAKALQAAEAELDRVTGKADEAAASQRALEQAFKALRVTSQEELHQAAEDARANFETIQQAFERGAASVEDVRRAFEAYAQQQRAAVADSDQWAKDQVEAQLSVQASTLGLSSALQKTGEAGWEAGEKIATGFGEARKGIDAATEAAQRHISATEASAAAIEASSAATEAARGSLQGYSIDLSQFSANAIKAFAEAQEAAMRFGISNDAALEQYVRTLNDANHRIMAEIEQQKSGIASLSAYYAGLTDAQIEQQARMMGGMEKLLASIENVATSAANATGQFSLLNQSDLSGLSAAASAAAARVRAIQQAAESAKQSMENLAASFQEEIFRMQGNLQAAENARFEAQLAQLKAQAEAAGVLQSAEYQEAVRRATELHQLKMKQLAEEAKQKKADDEAAAKRAQSQGQSSAGNGSGFTGGGEAAGTAMQGGEQNPRAGLPVPRGATAGSGWGYAPAGSLQIHVNVQGSVIGGSKEALAESLARLVKPELERITRFSR